MSNMISLIYSQKAFVPFPPVPALSSAGLLQHLVAVHSSVAGHAQHVANAPSPSLLPSGAGCKIHTKPELFRQGSDGRIQPQATVRGESLVWKPHPLERATRLPVEAAPAEHRKPRGVPEISQSLLMAPGGIHSTAATELQPFHLSVPGSFLFSFYLLPNPPVYLSPGSLGASAHCEHPLPLQTEPTRPRGSTSSSPLSKPYTGALGS